MGISGVQGGEAKDGYLPLEDIKSGGLEIMGIFRLQVEQQIYVYMYILKCKYV